MAAEKVTIEGVIENVVFYNEDNDYSVLEIALPDGNLLSATGSVPIPCEGEVLKACGYFEYHAEYGQQFRIEQFEKSLPIKEEDIITFLSSRAIKGIGPVTALKIVNKFGTETFDVMRNHPEWLADIPGITHRKAAEICENFSQVADYRGVFMFCQKYMESGDISRVYKKFGSGAVGIIRQNPYILCEGDLALPFEKADEIANSFGLDKRHPERLFYGMRSVLLREGQSFGHTALPVSKLVNEASKVLSLSEGDIRDTLNSFLQDEKFFLYQINDEQFVMTEEVFRAEEFICRRIQRLNKNIYRYAHEDILLMLERIELNASIRYATMQRLALVRSVENGVMIMTGGPGTGKTTVIKGMLHLFDNLGQNVVLCAPTGRAAKRMSEATGYEAKTIHRLLEMEKRANDDFAYNRNQHNPIEEDVVIVDEASMMDLFLMEALLRAMPRSGRLILIGDSHQLPSVGAGNVLADLILSGAVETVMLTDIFRQSEESLIVTNAHKIHNGEYPVLNRVDRDFFFVSREDESQLANTVTSLIMERLPRTYGRDIMEKIQVITPSKKGNGGVITLNEHLQRCMNPPQPFKKEKSAHGIVFREGDRVMQIVNDYEMSWEKNGVEGQGVFNGDIGRIETINNAEKYMHIRFEDRVAFYPFDKLKNLDLSYAITVHKSQGSEYPVVIVPIFHCPPMLLTRNLIYTAVTRAKKMVILVGKVGLVRQMVDNTREILRYTTLCDRLKSSGNEQNI